MARPLPHQLEAVYDQLLKRPRVRFRLADDAGAGLLIGELQLRRLVEWILLGVMVLFPGGAALFSTSAAPPFLEGQTCCGWREPMRAQVVLALDTRSG